LIAGGGAFNLQYSYGSPEPHYDDIAHYLMRTGIDQAPPFLIRKIYDLNPDAAVRTLEYARFRGEMIGAEYLDVAWAIRRIDAARLEYRVEEPDPQAMADLRRLSISPHWWVRLYVASIMWEHKVFRRQEIIDALAADPNELVREGVGRIKDQMAKEKRHPPN
jgi:hypothetical protein